MQFCLSDQLKHLDLTCNPRMLIDSDALSDVDDECNVSLVDIGSNSDAASLAIGFSETAGERNRCVIRIYFVS